MKTNAVRPISTNAQTSWRWWLNKSAIYIALLAAMLAVTLSWAPYGHPAIYFLEQDAALLLLCAAGLIVFSRTPFPDRALALTGARTRWLMIIVAAAFAYYGSHRLLGQYAISRDEQLAEFGAEYLSNGLLGWPIPPNLRPVADALMPLWAGQFVPAGYWTSGYLPVNSLLRAGFVSMGDGRLSGPVLLVVAAASLWSAGRRLWPAASSGPLVAMVLLLTSAQVLATAMTAYAMTAHLALNALWLACFLRNDKRGHATAIVIGFLATGLHQVQFHVLFVGGFVIWLWWQDRRRLALLYGAACAAYIAFWIMIYPHLLPMALGYVPQSGPNAVSSNLIDRLMRLRELELGTSLARFVAWQNLLLVPLVIVGGRQALSPEGRRSPLCALTLSCLTGLATMVFQGHGYGYRYLHGTLPAFCLVAAGGWQALERDARRPMPGGLLWGSSLVALLLTTPFALWKSQQFNAPYVAAYHAVRAAPSDVVLVDRNSGRWIQDIVRLDPAYSRPLLMDLGNVTPTALAHLCATRSVMIFGDRQARAVGMRPSVYAPVGDETGARLRQLATLGCGQPVPIR